jgi:methionyl-tRNA formyltransferase
MKKEDLKIVFLGNPDFAVESLATLVDNGFNIVGVVTGVDKPAGRGHKLLQSAVKQYALSKSLNILQPEKLKDPTFLEQLSALQADLFIVIAFRMLPEAVWQMPRLGTFNLHASLLPKYRGAAPINWAVINGDTTTGVTTFFLKHDIDTGDIIAQEAIDILPDDNVGDVHDKLMHLGARLTLTTVNAIVDGTLSTTPQDLLLNGAEPTPAPKIFRETTCHIDWNKTALQVHNLVRGLSPYPCAWTELPMADGTMLTAKIQQTAITDRPATSAGNVVVEANRLFISATDHLVEIVKLQPAGKKAMPAADFLRGAHLK